MCLSCKKKKFEEGEAFYEHAYNGPINQDSVSYSNELISGHKILIISSQNDLNRFTSFVPLTSVLSLTNVEFSKDILCVAVYSYEAQGAARITSERLTINSENSEIEFRIKVKARTGGSGIGNYFDFIYIKVPKEYIVFNISGQVKFKHENNIIQGSGLGSWKTNYSLL